MSVRVMKKLHLLHVDPNQFLLYFFFFFLLLRLSDFITLINAI